MDYIKKLNNKTDEELINIIRDTNNEFATNVLLSRYDNIVKTNASKIFILGGEKDDVFQEGRIGLYKAIQNYDIKAGSSFKTFATLCIKRQLITAIKVANRQKNNLLNYAISIDSPVDEMSSDNEFVTYLEDKNSLDPSDIITKNESIQTLTDEIYNALSVREKNVFNEYLNGKSYAEISKDLNIKLKSVDTALSRVRKKINKIQKDELNIF